MNDFAFEQIRDSCYTDMWMWSDLHALTGRKFRGAHVVKKNKRTHHAAFAGWQYAVHRKFAQVPGLGVEREFDGSVAIRVF